MKKLIFVFLFLVLGSYVGFGQATPSGQLRVADTSVVFGQNIPVGTSLFVVADSTYWVSVAPVTSTYNLNKSYYKLMPSHTQKWVLIGVGATGGPTLSDTTGFFSAWHIVQEFDESTTHAHGETHVLVGPAIPNSVVISLNGMELKRSEYELTTCPGCPISDTGIGVFYIKIPVYQYDRIKILYAYTLANALPPE